MFEKEAEERTEEKYICNEKEIIPLEAIGYKKGFKDGAEFGYNKGSEDFAKQLKEVVETCNHWQEVAEKANEWHYVKDGDLPNTETKNYTYIRRRKRYERQFTDYRVIKCFVLCQNENGKITAEVGYFDCNKKCFFDKAEGKVIAWKEIVLPELKESE